MSMYDEFRPLPPEDRELPPEFSNRKDEENHSSKAYAGSNEKKTERKQNKSKQKRMTKLLAKLTAGTLVVTGTGFINIDFGGVFAEGRHYEFEIGENATLVDAHTVRLTDLKRQSIGSLWSNEQISFEKDVTVEFDILQGNSEFGDVGNGTDGVAMGFSDIPNDISEIAGGGLGYNSQFGVEFDLFYNPPEETGGRDDFMDDHYAILGDNVWNHLSVGPRTQLDDGEWHHVSVTYSSGELSFFYDGIKKLESDIDANISQDGMYLTFSGATGDGVCYQYISNVLINGSEISIVDASGTPIGGAGLEAFSEEAVEQEYQYINRETEDPDIDEPDYLQELMEEQEDSVDDDIGDSDEDTVLDAEEQTTSRTQTVTCDECNGTGIICPGSIEADDPEGCHGEVIVDCKACNGTGKEDNGDPCNWCKGTLRHLCPSFEVHRTCEKCGGTGQYEILMD